LGVGVLQRLSDIEISIGYAGSKWILDNTGVPARILLGDVGQNELEAIPDYILAHGRVFVESTPEQYAATLVLFVHSPLKLKWLFQVTSDLMVVRVVDCSGLAIHGQVGPDLDGVVAGLVWVQL